MIAVWPTSMIYGPKRGSWVGGPQDTLARFKPEYGEEIVRPRTTAQPHVYQAVFPSLTDAQRAAFDLFVSSELNGGALSFAMRDPVSQITYLWRLMAGSSSLYSFVAKGAGRHDLSVDLMRLPGVPWWSTYVRAGTLVVPYVVADYQNGVFGIDGARTPASAVALVAGTFDIYTTSTGGVVTAQIGITIAAGGIPATAPGGVARKVAF